MTDEDPELVEMVAQAIAESHGRGWQAGDYRTAEVTVVALANRIIPSDAVLEVIRYHPSAHNPSVTIRCHSDPCTIGATETQSVKLLQAVITNLRAELAEVTKERDELVAHLREAANAPTRWIALRDRFAAVVDLPTTPGSGDE